MAGLAQIGEAIRRVRKQRKLSAQELANRTGMHRNTVLALETGRGNIELVRLLAICEQLGLDIALVPQPVAALRRADTPDAADAGRTELSERMAWLMQPGPRS